MVLPKYIETQWYGEGKSVLRFSQRSTQDGESENSKGNNSIVGKITCYMSSLHIREYEEKVATEDDVHPSGESQEEAEVQPSGASQVEAEVQPTGNFQVGAEGYTCPPEVPPEIWQGWIVYWESMKTIFIPLAWVHKYRSLCTSSYIEWHDTYLEANPHMVSHIREGLSSSTIGDIPESDLDEETIFNLPEDKRKEIIDVRYNKLAYIRYWIHLRIYLQNHGIPTNENLIRFYREHAKIELEVYWNFVEHPNNVLQVYRNVKATALSEKANASVPSENANVSVLSENTNKSHNEHENYIPEFMRDKDKVTVFEAQDFSKESEESDNASADESKEDSDDTLSNVGNKKEQTLLSSEEKVQEADLNVDDATNMNNKSISKSDDLDKLGTKRRQEDLYKDGHIVDGEDEKDVSMLSKRPRHNLLNKQECEDKEVSDVDPKGKSAISVDSDKIDYDVTDEDKENVDVDRISENAKDNKKLSKLKKKKKQQQQQQQPVRHKDGLGWVLRYLEKAAAEKEEMTANKQQVGKGNLDQTSTSNDAGNIFSVSDICSSVKLAPYNGNCMSDNNLDKIPDQGDTSSSLGNLPSANYQFRPDKLNLKENTNQLRKCFSVHGEDGQSQLKAGDGENDEGSGISNIDYLTFGKGENSADNGDDEITQDKYLENEDSIANEKAVAALNKETQNSSGFFPASLPAVKNFVVMCASHLLGLIFPNTPGQGLHIGDGQGPISVVKHLFGFGQSADKIVDKKKGKDPSVRKLQKWLRQVSDYAVCLPDKSTLKDFYSVPAEREAQAVYQSVETIIENDGSSYLTINTLNLEKMIELDSYYNFGSEYDVRGYWKRNHVVFDDDGNPVTASEKFYWDCLIPNFRLMSYKMKDEVPPTELPQHLHKYWAQRHRLFLRYDEGIKLDEESWYSVTPEMISSHHAFRCSSDVVIDAFCGSGGNAIQLANTCYRVIAIDIDPAKIELARHNAAVYGLEGRIEFIVGDFLQLAPMLSADVVFLSPPWGGTKYLEEEVYDVKKLGGAMNCEELMAAAKSITEKVAIYLPRSSNLSQVIEFAGINGVVDLEFNYMGKKRKSLTAYFGDLVHYY